METCRGRSFIRALAISIASVGVAASLRLISIVADILTPIAHGPCPSGDESGGAGGGVARLSFGAKLSWSCGRIMDFVRDARFVDLVESDRLVTGQRRTYRGNFVELRHRIKPTCLIQRQHTIHLAAERGILLRAAASLADKCFRCGSKKFAQPGFARVVR